MRGDTLASWSLSLCALGSAVKSQPEGEDEKSYTALWPFGSAMPSRSHAKTPGRRERNCVDDGGSEVSALPCSKRNPPKDDIPPSSLDAHDAHQTHSQESRASWMSGYIAFGVFALRVIPRQTTWTNSRRRLIGSLRTWWAARVGQPLIDGRNRSVVGRGRVVVAALASATFLLKLGVLGD